MELRDLLRARPEVVEAAERCLLTRRWQGNVAAMVLDAAITSTGVSYFSVVVPRVRALHKEIKTLSQLSRIKPDRYIHLWKNRRSWSVATQLARVLEEVDENDTLALRSWAYNSDVRSWKQNPVGKIKGVGINTFQYLRMMGGVDTVMPDNIVRRFASQFGITTRDDLEFIGEVERLCKRQGIKAVEFCFLAWIEQYPKDKAEEYLEILRRI